MGPCNTLAGETSGFAELPRTEDRRALPTDVRRAGTDLKMGRKRVAEGTRTLDPRNHNPVL